MVELNRELLSLFPGVLDLLEVYRELDAHIEDFKKAVGVECIESCGRCCVVSSSKVEASVFEMIPLAIHLWETGEANNFLKKIDWADQNSQCVLFDGGGGRSSPGHCMAYPFRDLMCRLFGFSAVENKYGRPVMALCSVMKDRRPGVREEIQRRIDHGLRPPVYKNYAYRIILADSQYGLPLFPINEAIQKALELVEYRRALLLRGQDLEARQGSRKHFRLEE